MFTESIPALKSLGYCQPPLTGLILFGFFLLSLRASLKSRDYFFRLDERNVNEAGRLAVTAGAKKQR